MGGPIEDKHRGKRDRRRSDNDPLSGELGDRDAQHNDFDTNERTIKDQKNKGESK
ncbi:hypothetical protein RM553_06490 [Zunongwangia sp. F363]|uniref:YpzI family protein n=1 Tax=Autumnicola tepida TaxID=3075595 RepID=A0ABU3C8E1_9FLAO|nr:hypothetical protein [Zunongwangia sp. F363]MDT0642477.1 hypothetical protein [Zunongwangia sp. F363]